MKYKAIFLSFLILGVLGGLFVQDAYSNMSLKSDDLFKTKADSTLIIYRKIPFLRGADINEFRESYRSSRRDLRRELVGEAIDLIDMGAKGMEALFIIKEFDKMVTHRRNRSHQNFSLSLESFVKSRLNELYREFRPRLRKLDFSYLNGGLDMFMYGSYSVSDRIRGGVILTLTIVNITTNIERSFIAEGTPKHAAFSVAGQLFHEFHSTRFPTDFDMGMGKKITLLEKNVITGTYTTPIRNSYKQANARCHRLGGRLPTMDELNMLQMEGGYKGGVFIGNKRQDYYWALDGDDVYISYDRRITSIYQISGAKFFNYICVK